MSLKSLIEDRERITHDIEVMKGHLRNAQTTLANKDIDIARIIGKTELADRSDAMDIEVAKIKAIGEAWESTGLLQESSNETGTSALANIAPMASTVPAYEKGGKADAVTVDRNKR